MSRVSLSSSRSPGRPEAADGGPLVPPRFRFPYAGIPTDVFAERAPYFRPKLKIVISHALPLVSVGLLGMLSGMPDCDVRIWSAELQRQYGSPRNAGAHVLVSDPAGGAEILGRGSAHSLPELVLIVSDQELDGARFPLVRAPAAYLPIAADRHRVIQTVRKVGASARSRPGPAPAPQAKDDAARTSRAETALELPRRRDTSDGARPCSLHQAPPRGGLSPFALQRVCRHVEERLGDKVSPRELAAIAGFSVSHFSRAFKESVGVPPHRYISWRRVEAAANLIRDTARPLAEISLAVGFSDQSHFTRMFLRLIGETPGAFRRRHR